MISVSKAAMLGNAVFAAAFSPRKMRWASAATSSTEALAK